MNVRPLHDRLLVRRVEENQTTKGGLIIPDSGLVSVDGLNVASLKRKDLAHLRTRIGYVFQNGALFDSMDVKENIRLGITNEDLYDDMDYCESRVKECLRLVNLQPEVAAKLPSELSGGMRKRVGIARAIAGKPKYLLYDEPTSGLDPVNSDVIDGLVERLQDELGVTSVVVTHDMNSAFKVADRIVMLHEGHIVFDGTPDEIQKCEVPEVKRFVEGEAGEQELATLKL
jgi:phospholipid/cholesterol/gamma-HCH transport system ATP-binding protein